jgi:hypothetical protein
MNKLKYDKYIIDQPNGNLPEFDFMRTRILHSSKDIVPGALWVNCVWYYKGSDSVLTKAHTHDCDEIIAFMGSNPDDPHDLGGEVEMWLGDEKYIITKSTIVVAPGGLVHCPLIIRRVDRPIFHFTAMTERGVHFVDS